MSDKKLKTLFPNKFLDAKSKKGEENEYFIYFKSAHESDGIIVSASSGRLALKKLLQKLGEGVRILNVRKL